MADRRILVVAAHPDDEVLGCGGTIARHARTGDEVHILIVAEGVTGRADADADREIPALHAAALKASRTLGARSVSLLGLPDNRLDSMDRLDLIQRIERVVFERRPCIVYTHSNGDLNVDHRRVHEAVVTACRPVPDHPVETLLFFEVNSSTEWQLSTSAQFQPNWFEDISEDLDTKLAALSDYAAEMRPWPHPRSIEAVTHLARWRGATCGTTAAEAFVLGRHIARVPGPGGR